MLIGGQEGNAFDHGGRGDDAVERIGGEGGRELGGGEGELGSEGADYEAAFDLGD